MRDVLVRIVDEAWEREFPAVTTREARPAEMPGKANVVVGMRRTGKTWFCYQQILALLAAGVPRPAILYLNFEDDRLLPFGASDFDVLLELFHAGAVGKTAQGAYLFLDELQRIAGWEKFTRRLVDAGDYHLWLTGSSAKLLSTEIATAMRGRSLTTEIFPLSFAEFVRWHGGDASAEHAGPKRRAELQNAAGAYLRTGGFPEVQAISDDLRRQVLQSYVDVVLMRDVIERHSISNVVALRWLLRMALGAPATRFSVNKAFQTLKSQQIRCTKNDLYAFMDHLCDSYLLYRVEIHSRSQKARQVNPQKVYAIDSGLLQAMTFRNSDDRGAMLENLAFMHLRRQGIVAAYCITQSGAEVDFVFTTKSGAQHLLQVCWSMEEAETRGRELRAMKEARAETKADRMTILTWLDEGEDEGVRIVPAWRWLLESQS